MIYRSNNPTELLKITWEKVSWVVFHAFLPHDNCQNKFLFIDEKSIKQTFILFALDSHSSSIERLCLYVLPIAFNFGFVSSNKNITLMQTTTKTREQASLWDCEMENKWIMMKILYFGAGAKSKREREIYWIFIIVHPRRTIFVLQTIFVWLRWNSSLLRVSMYCEIHALLQYASRDAWVRACIVHTLRF